MSDRLADIKAALDRGEVNYRGEHDDLCWLVAEVERLRRHEAGYEEEVVMLRRELGDRNADLFALRQRHAESVEVAFREGYRCLLDAPESSHEEDAAWLASEAKKGVHA